MRLYLHNPTFTVQHFTNAEKDNKNYKMKFGQTLLPCSVVTCLLSSSSDLFPTKILCTMFGANCTTTTKTQERQHWDKGLHYVVTHTKSLDVQQAVHKYWLYKCKKVKWVVCVVDVYCLTSSTSLAHFARCWKDGLFVMSYTKMIPWTRIHNKEQLKNEATVTREGNLTPVIVHMEWFTCARL